MSRLARHGERIVFLDDPGPPLLFDCQVVFMSAEEHDT
jgi:hypothetical protein